MFVVFDIGATSTRVGIANGFDSLDKTIILPTHRDYQEGKEKLIKEIYALIKGDTIAAIAGGIAGTLDSTKEKILHSPNLPLWESMSLAYDLKKTFSCPVFLENDAAIGGLGEAVFGSGKGKDIVGYIAVGTGLGGSRIVHGGIDTNTLGFEPGHQIIVINGEEDACGKYGHLEAYVGGRFIKSKYGKDAEDIQDPSIWDEITTYLAVGLVNTIVHWSPDCILISGSVAEHIELSKIRSYLDKALVIFPKKPEILKGTLGTNSGLYGGLALLKSKL